VGLGVAGAEMGEGDEEGVGVKVGVLGVSVTAGRGTMVGVDEAATALLKTVPQPVSRISKTEIKPNRIIFLIRSTPHSNRTYAVGLSMSFRPEGEIPTDSSCKRNLGDFSLPRGGRSK
jgi:hypothetical protein